MTNQHTYQSTIPPLAFVPLKFTNAAILTYFAALIGCSLVFSYMMMQWYWWVFGILEVLGFFYFANRQSRLWANIRTHSFEKSVFWTAFTLRVCVMLFLYWFHDTMTGQPFMFHAADAIGYHEEAKWMAQTIRDGNFSSYFNYKFVEPHGVSDAGYPMYLGFVYLISDDSILFARLLKALWGALTCLLIYRLGKRNFGEHVGRLAAILMMLAPHFYIYGSLHLKETEMVFMMMLFLERADNLVRNRKFNFRNIAVMIVLLASLFTFRTVLGLTAVFALVMALMLTSQRVMSWSKRIVFLMVFGATALYFAGGRIMSEIETVWELKDQNQLSRLSEIVRTQSLAKYAGAAVFAPMIFTIPFPTMVETAGQETSRLLHGGMMVKNIMSFFTIIALITLIFPLIPGYNRWREHVLIWVFLLAYLAILVFSAFAHADRFHMPALAIEVLFMAYGISICRLPQLQRWYKYWCVLMFIAAIAWNWFKLAGRGMV